MKSSEQKLSPSMSSGYNGAKPTMKKSMSVFEMAMYRKGAANSSENGSFSRDLPMPDRPLGHHHKSRSLAGGILDDILERSDVAEAGEGESDKWNDILLRRHQKSEANIKGTPELLLVQDNSSNGGFLSRTGKSLAQRQKSVSRTALTTDSEPSGINPMLIRLGKAFLFDEPSGVRKSSSTSCLQDKDNSGNSSIWLAFSATGIAKPIFDGLAKPITGRRNKAALD